jgi:hypothetical protein
MANTYVDAVTKTIDVNGTSFVYRTRTRPCRAALGRALSEANFSLLAGEPSLDSSRRWQREVAFDGRHSDAQCGRHVDLPTRSLRRSSRLETEEYGC